MTLFEELRIKGLDAGKLPLDLAVTITYSVEQDEVMGSLVGTYTVVKDEVN